MGREVLKWPYTVGEAPPPPPNQSDHRGKNRNLPLGKSGPAILGTQTLSQNPPPPPPPLSNTSLGGWGAWVGPRHPRAPAGAEVLSGTRGGGADLACRPGRGVCSTARAGYDGCVAPSLCRPAPALSLPGSFGWVGPRAHDGERRLCEAPLTFPCLLFPHSPPLPPQSCP